MKPRSRQPLVAVLAALAPVLLIAGIWLGGHSQVLPDFVADALAPNADTRVVNEALNRISHDYYRRVSRSALQDSSIAGMVAKLNDRFSQYLDPREYRDYTQESDARFSGVGLRVAQDPRGLLVVTVYDRSPAARAGIAVGDRILAVGARSIAGLSETPATALIKGRPGTDVALTFLHGHRRLTRTLTRTTVTVPVVASSVHRLGPHRLDQIALATFSSGAHGEVRRALRRSLTAGARGIVLDLRHNGGGLVDEARLVASIFVARGTIVTTRGRTQPTQSLTATGNAIADSIPVVVLVDANTASAAEIVTGALQDHHRALVVGSHTFGKGVFQEVQPLSNGGALDITVGQYFTPAGHNLGGAGVRQGAGITPDVKVAANAGGSRDGALATALRTLDAQVK